MGEEEETAGYLSCPSFSILQPVPFAALELEQKAGAKRGHGLCVAYRAGSIFFGVGDARTGIL